MSKKPVVIIVGPTAVGKTEVSIDIAQRLEGEIISADSMQIYKYMDIGTAKPEIHERRGIPHHLLDFIDPREDFNVTQFQQLAHGKINEIQSANRLPIVVGGTGLYINSLTYPLDFSEAGEDIEFRLRMKAQIDVKGKEWLHSQLRIIDPVTANRLHPNDIRRIIRAMEIHHITGKPMSEYRQEFREEELPYFFIMIGLTIPRSRLYDRINQRVDIMIEKGLVEEVQTLLMKGYSSNLVSMQGLGYKEIVAYLKGMRTLTEASEILKKSTRRFAKRQYTWFRRESRIQWIDIDQFSSQEKLTDSLIALIETSLKGYDI